MIQSFSLVSPLTHEHRRQVELLAVILRMSVLFPVGEEDEVSIKEAAEAVVESLGFKGQVVVSFQASFSLLRFSYIHVQLLNHIQNFV